MTDLASELFQLTRHVFYILRLNALREKQVTGLDLVYKTKIVCFFAMLLDFKAICLCLYREKIQVLIFRFSTHEIFVVDQKFV